MQQLTAKIIIVGNISAGKSALLLRFINQQWVSTTSATIGVDFRSRTVEVRGGNTIRLQLWDSSGQEEFQSVAKGYFRHACAAFLVFDTTSRTSFAQLPKWLEAVKEHSGNKELIICLVGTKCDLIEKRVVSKQEGEAFARERNVLFVECSAKTGENVELAFVSTANSIFRKVDQGVFDLNNPSHGVKVEDSRSSDVTAVPRVLTIANNQGEERCCF